MTHLTFLPTKLLLDQYLHAIRVLLQGGESPDVKLVIKNKVYRLNHDLPDYYVSISLWYDEDLGVKHFKTFDDFMQWTRTL